MFDLFVGVFAIMISSWYGGVLWERNRVRRKRRKIKQYREYQNYDVISRTWD